MGRGRESQGTGNIETNITVTKRVQGKETSSEGRDPRAGTLCGGAQATHCDRLPQQGWALENNPSSGIKEP